MSGKTVSKIFCVVLAASLVFSAGWAASLVRDVGRDIAAMSDPEPAPGPGTAPTSPAASEVTAPEEQTVPAVAEWKTVAAGSSDASAVLDDTPSIVVPGIGQSLTFMYDENGELARDSSGDVITGWPLHFDVKYLVKQLIFPLLGSLIFQTDMGLSDAAASALSETFSVNAKDANGYGINDVRVVKYMKSVAELDEEDKEYVYKEIPLRGYSALVGEENLYYFAYNSFDRTLDLGDELYEYIEMVKAQRGTDKVNLVAISLGGTIANALLERHKEEVAGSINKLVYIVPAVDGSQIVGDVFAENFNLTDASVYSELLPSLMDDYTGYLANLALRLLPKQVLLDTLTKGLRAVIRTALVNTPSMWALVPSGMYPELSAKWLSGEENAAMREITGEYYRAQLNRFANVQYLIDRGVWVSDIVDYDFPLYSVVASWTDYNADGVIHLGSTSFNAYSVPTGQTFPEGYSQKNTYCTNPSHNHISPENDVDASAGYLCEYTWYFSHQGHESTGRNDVIMNLAIKLLTSTDHADVRTWSEYPQFMMGRDGRTANNRISEALDVDLSGLSPVDAAELEAAVNELRELLSTSSVTAEDFARFEAAFDRLNDILVKIGVRAPEEDPTADWKYVFFKWMSDSLYNHIGGKGYSDILLDLFR
ncbi:MAG: alpha/beta hydrolase [Clostridia bacterium]|nr:alpha/beta hydrolase [Clostridia bacterium]